MIIHGDGGVIYVDYDLVTATTSVDVESEDVFAESEVTDEQLDNVMEHNNKLVGVLKNTLEMQAYLFDKLLSYIFWNLLHCWHFLLEISWFFILKIKFCEIIEV